MPAAITDASIAQYEFEIEINGTPERVWKGLTDQLTSWWLQDFRMLGEDSIVTLEPFPGGRLYEQRGDAGLLWYTVIAINPNKSLSLAGYCTPDFGGPCTTLLTLKLTPADKGTRLTVSDALYGKVQESQVTSLNSGWKQLFNDGLRKFVESN